MEPTEKQLKYLRVFLGYKGPTPKTIKDASQLISKLKKNQKKSPFNVKQELSRDVSSPEMYKCYGRPSIMVVGSKRKRFWRSRNK